MFNSSPVFDIPLPISQEELNLIFNLTIVKQSLEIQILQFLSNTLNTQNSVQSNGKYQEIQDLKLQNRQDAKQTVFPHSESSGHLKQIKNKAPKKQPLRNDSKNIPRNFGKAIIIFIEKNEQIVRRVLDRYNIDYLDYREKLIERKRQMNGILQLRNIWVDKEFKYAKVTRILSMFFMKRRALPYIFKSKSDYCLNHIKYRRHFFKILQNPEEFICVKNMN